MHKLLSSYIFMTYLPLDVNKPTINQSNKRVVR